MAGRGPAGGEGTIDGGEPTTSGAAGIGGAAGSPDTNTGEPDSCAAAKARGIVQDGLVFIDPDGDGAVKPFEVHCAGMETDSPLEFLELPHTDATGYANMNTSTYSSAGDGSCPCPDSLKSSFSRVRLRISDLSVLIADRTFATFLGDATCHIANDACHGELLGYATAADCRGDGTVTGTAEVDLGGTSFHIAPEATFAPFGYAPQGAFDVATGRKRVSIAGGGFCGGYAPTDSNYPGEGWQMGGELPLEQD